MSRVAWRRGAAAGAIAVSALALAGCSTLGYLGRSVRGHLDVLAQARPIDDWLADPATPPALAERLRDAKGLRGYAADRLALPRNASYTRYAELGREAVVWNVVAAPALSLKLKTWCYPVLGCVGYRGHFDRARADAEARALAADGWEVHVYGVPAYSTLGWTNWLGGDPLLNTFVTGDRAALAALLFHELAHQRVHVPDDTTFNESYASAVEKLGLAQWRAEAGGAGLAVPPPERVAAQRTWREALLRARRELDATYRGGAPADAQGARKAEIFERLRAEYAVLRAGAWRDDPRRDAWVASMNNATLALQAAYDARVPAFEALFAREGRDFERFHRAVQALAALPATARSAALDALAPPTP